MRRLPPWLLPVLVCLLVPAAGTARERFGTVAVSARPSLFPRFSPATTDYVTRCRGERGVRLSVRTWGGGRVALGRRARSGRFDVVAHVSPGRAFSFTTTAAGRTRTHYVRCLPPKFPTWTFQRLRPSRPHLTLLAPGLALGKPTRPYAAIFDENGVPLWWYALPPAVVDAELLPDGTVALARFEGGTFGDDPDGAYEIRRLDGSLVRRVRTLGGPTDDHELQVTAGGNYLLLSYVPRAGVDLRPLGGPASAVVLDAEIQIVNPRGALVWRWNSKDHVDLAESAQWPLAAVRLRDGRTAYDIVHANSVQLVGSTVVLSLRHTSSVYGIDRATGAVEWKLGGSTTPASLAVAGTGDAPLLSGQHFARLRQNGTLTVHDNGTNAGRRPRALRFKLDLAHRKATLVEAVQDPSAGGLSLCCGSATRLDDGRWIVSWGGESLIGEYAPGGAPIWRLALRDGLFSYRAIPIRPDALSRARLRRAMNVLNPRR